MKFEYKNGSFAYVDVETSGGSCGEDRIIEIGGRVDRRGKGGHQVARRRVQEAHVDIRSVLPCREFFRRGDILRSLGDELRGKRVSHDDLRLAAAA